MLTERKRAEALRVLSELYPDARPALEFTTPFELLVAVMLSAQCTDKMVNICTRRLFPVANTPEQLAAMSEAELEPYIHSCGFFRAKGRHILETSRILVTEYGGRVPETVAELQKLPGVGRKTANVVAANAFGVPTIAVDTHVFRVSNRIGLAEAATVEKTEAQLEENIPRGDWIKAHHWLIYHGRQVCSSQRPKCGTCALSGVCQYHMSAQMPTQTEKRKTE